MRTRTLFAGLVAGLFATTGFLWLARPADAGSQLAIKVTAEEEKRCPAGSRECPVAQLKIDVKCPASCNGCPAACNGPATGTVECEFPPSRAQCDITSATLADGLLTVSCSNTPEEAVWTFGGAATAQRVKDQAPNTVCAKVGRPLDCGPDPTPCTIKTELKNAP